MKVLVAQSCMTLCDPEDCMLPGSSVHGLLQARILGWVAIPLPGGFSWPRDWTRVSCITGRFFTIWATSEALGGYEGGNKCETFILKQFQTCQAYSFSFSFLYPRQISVLYYSWTWTYMLFINTWDSDYSCVQRGKLLSYHLPPEYLTTLASPTLASMCHYHP